MLFGRRFLKKDSDRVMFVNKQTFRYDLKGSGKHDAMTLDDVVAIAPYMERVIYVGDVPDWMIRRMNNTFNTYSHHNIIPDWVLAGDLDDMQTADTYELYTHEVDLPKIKTKLEKFNFDGFVLRYTGNRDTLYWLDYVRTAFPCEGREKTEFKKPYFYDPKELEEEETDGKLSGEDMIIESGGDDDTNGNEVWTIPPGGEYLGYIPGKGETNAISNSVYEDYKTPEERQKEKEDSEALNHHNSKSSTSDLKSQLKQRKKTQKSIIKGFAITFAGLLLLVPVVCLIMQLGGWSVSWWDDDGRGDYDGIGGIYDKEEMRLLRRRRLMGAKFGKDQSLPRHTRPLKEIEII